MASMATFQARPRGSMGLTYRPRSIEYTTPRPPERPWVDDLGGWWWWWVVRWGRGWGLGGWEGGVLLSLSLSLSPLASTLHTKSVN